MALNSNTLRAALLFAAPDYLKVEDLRRMVEAAEGTLPTLGLRAFAARREEFHGTFNGGWRDNPEALRAFHHGMDTVFNCIEKALETES